MKSTYNLQKTAINFSALMLLLLFGGCEDYLEVDEPVGQIATATVFNDENTATAAITSLYGMLRDRVILTGNSNGIGSLMGLYSDELDYYGAPGESMEHFYNHQILASDLRVKELWDNAYHLIYMCNAALEGIEESETLTHEMKEQLSGEVLFIRGLVHFYLVNIFGDIPYIKTTDYQLNAKAKRMAEETVYDNILTDLLESKNLLSMEYPTGERTRANKWVVSAFLARVYLYMEQWHLAELEAGELINNTSMFNLEPELANVFLKESTSAIFQFKPKNEGDNTLEGSTYIFSTVPPPLMALNNSLVQDMEDEDLRRQFWIQELTDGSNTWYFPIKYKQNLNTGSSLEYSIVFRIAEQYLIRAEAHLMQGNLTVAKNDINVIRTRAGLENSTASTTQEILNAIIQERRFELFSEYGHRWFDLRRLDRAGAVLSPIKIGWKPTDILLPIPESELLLNPNLEPQNPGY
ncbi:MAG: RagB/SusD family nutrient uptake outer membrane protein [Aequorivita sp.]